MTFDAQTLIAALTTAATVVAAVKAKNYRAATNVLVDSIEEASRVSLPPKQVVERRSAGTTAGKIIERTVRKRTRPLRP